MSEPTQQASASEPTPSPKHLIAKLAEIVKQIDHVEKSGRNEFHRYNYVKAADVAWAVRKALSEQNIYLVSDVIEVRNYEIPAKDGHMQAVDVKMEFSFFDGDCPSTQPVVLHAWGTGTDKGDKAVYKAQTGALKYGLRHAFLIPDESDPEADTATDKATASENAKNVGKRKVEAANAGKEPSSVVLSLFYTYNKESKTYTISGSDEYMHANRDLLKPLWNPAAKAVLANEDQLEGLKYTFESREIPFKPLKAV
jgi:ERF superfamily